PDPGWVTAPESADRGQLEELADQGLPVVVPARSVADVDRLVGFVTEQRAGASPRRSTAARARRRPGIDYDVVPASLAATAVEPGDPAYRSVASTYLRK